MIGLHIEGNLIAPALTAELSTGDIKGQTVEDFGFKKTDKLADEIAIAWGDAKAYWAAFQRGLMRLDVGDTATSLTREQWAVLLLKSLGYSPVYTPKAQVIDGQTYAISHRATDSGENQPPIHIIGCRLQLEKRPPSGSPRLSAHALMQDYLNRTEYLWGIVTNGLQWRLLRNCSLMTRLSYIEFDLEQILNGENFAEFGLFYRLFHSSRLPSGIENADKCWLEYYHQEAIQQGGRVRDRLRDGVEQALIKLGTGFLQHPKSNHLREKFSANYELVYYRQLLLLIYRLLFLMVAESRHLLLMGDEPEKARIYQEYYSIQRLRNLAEIHISGKSGFQDIWQGLKVTFKLFDENWRGQLLELSPLNGDLFGSGILEDLDLCRIDNHDLLLAIRHLSLYDHKGQYRRVNYAALDVEELGSVYESLLDFHPVVIQKQGVYEFQLISGSERKTTGSYYTPPELVAQLIKSALEPVIENLGSRETLRADQRSTGVESREQQEQALLSLKVCDPACGSGHFLLAAARRLGKELAVLRTGETQPSPEPLRKAIRDVIQHCIYGVDLNPLAVDLCKVALWIEGFSRGLPLNFLDHRIKCGNSLVGVLDITCLDEGIPDEAFKAVTGDNKSIATSLKKKNKKQRENIGQLSLFEDLDTERQVYSQVWGQLDELEEATTDDVRRKQSQYRENRNNPQWWRDHSACNLWTAAFFMPLTEQQLQLLPSTEVLNQLLRGNISTQKIVDAANQLAAEKRFFHWCLEFPEVFDPPVPDSPGSPPLIRGVGGDQSLEWGRGGSGFDCVLGNPPWERIKLQEKEFFARNFEIANAKTKAARDKLIKGLPENNPTLYQAFEDAKHDAEAQGKFIRESGRFPLTSVGDINTYSVFAETTRKLIGSDGRVGIIVPTGIATDDTCKKFFGDLIQKQTLASLYDFENRENIFPGIGHGRFKFSLISISGSCQENTKFSFFLTKPKQIEDDKRVFKLSPEDIALMNPNTLTCPVFRTRIDAEITKKIYQRVPVLENEKTGVNPWVISFMTMFHMANDSGLFKNEGGEERLPLYEAKMFWHYNHRFGDYNDYPEGALTSHLPDISGERLENPNYKITPRYWLDKIEVENKLANKWDKEWLLTLRCLTNSTNERTAIFSLLPRAGLSNSSSLIISSLNDNKIVGLLANFNSIVFDFVTRQKLGGNNFSAYIVKQLPIIPPDWYTPEDIEYISSRVLELVYTSYDLKPFAEDMGYEGEPFIWNEQRRAKLRAELDAKYAKLYGLTRDELRYILDPADVYGAEFPSETFRVLKNNEIKQYGEYRTQRLVLAAWDIMG